MQSAKRRRIIIVDDSDSDECRGPAPPAIMAPADATPAAAPAVDLLTVSSDTLRPSQYANDSDFASDDLPDIFSSSGSESDDPDDPISRKARKLALLSVAQRADGDGRAQAALMSPFLYAAQHGHFPPKSAGPSAPRPQHPTLDDGNLWNARPPVTSQYLEMEAAHMGSTTSGSTGASDGSLSDPDFIDRATPNFSREDSATLQQLFPIASRSMQRQKTDSVVAASPNSTIIIID